MGVGRTRPFVTSRLQPYASPAAGKAGGVRCPAACPPCSPNPRRGRAGAAVPAPAQHLSIPGMIWGRKMKPEPQPCGREPPRGASSMPRGPAQGTLLPRGGMWGQAPPAPGQGGERVGHQQTSCRRHRHRQPFLSPRQTDGWTDGRGTGSIPHASRCRRCSPCCDRPPAPPAPRPHSAGQAPASGRDQRRCGERGGL